MSLVPTIFDSQFKTSLPRRHRNKFIIVTAMSLAGAAFSLVASEQQKDVVIALLAGGRQIERRSEGLMGFYNHHFAKLKKGGALPRRLKYTQFAV